MSDAEELAKESPGDESFSSSVLESDARWSIVVNGVRYFGNERPGDMSSFGIANSSENAPAEHVETTKERNRRLLMKDRVIQAGRKKARKSKRAIRFNKSQKLLTVVEEDTLGDVGINAADTPGKNDTEEATSGNNANLRIAAKGERHHHIEHVLKKRTKVARRVGRTQRLICCENSKRLRFVVKITFGNWISALWPVENIIRLYSCSAFRYTAFKSNRRYKPGD